VVIYVGEGAGKNDSGKYEIDCVFGNKTLTWSYRVIHLWNIYAESLLETGIPAIIALIGQTRMEKPREVIHKAIQSIKIQVQDKQKQTHLYTILSSLQQNEEVMKMVEQYLEEMEVDLFDTPFLRRVRNEGYEKAISEGKEIWEAAGEEKGIEKGIEKGEINSLRTAILDSLSLRFTISLHDYSWLETQLKNIHQTGLLRFLHKKAILTEEVSTFMEDFQQLNPLDNKELQPA